MMTIFASPDGLEDNDGTETSPWPLSRGISELHSSDHHLLYLRGGIYVGPVEVVGLGDPLDPTSYPNVIRSFPGERAIIDGTIADFREAPNRTLSGRRLIGRV
jgi:hypothetical protein